MSTTVAADAALTAPTAGPSGEQRGCPAEENCPAVDVHVRVSPRGRFVLVDARGALAIPHMGRTARTDRVARGTSWAASPVPRWVVRDVTRGTFGPGLRDNGA